MAADGRSVLAEALSGDWTDELVFAGPASAQYDETSDGAHFLWMQDADQGDVRVAWDGRPSEPFELIPQASGEPFAWSAGKLRVAWYGRRLGRFFVAVDGIEHPWEGITRSVPPTFSAGGGRVAYGVYVDGIARLVVDGHVFGDWRPAPVAPVFSPDGGRFAFVAENRELTRGERRRDYRQWVVLDGVDQPDADGISSNEAGFQFSPDGRRFLYGRVEGKLVRLVVDGTAGLPYAEIAFPTFSPDSRRLVYAAGTDDRLVMLGDGVSAEAAFWRVSPPVFSPDSSRLGFFGFRGRAMAWRWSTICPGPSSQMSGAISRSATTAVTPLTLARTGPVDSCRDLRRRPSSATLPSECPGMKSRAIPTSVRTASTSRSARAAARSGARSSMTWRDPGSRGWVLPLQRHRSPRLRRDGAGRSRSGDVPDYGRRTGPAEDGRPSPGDRR